MSKNIFKKIGIGIMSATLFFPFVAFAQTVPGSPIITSPGGIIQILYNILNFVAAAVFLISLIMLLWAAILFLTAGASETAHTKAKNVLIYAIVGIAIALLAYSVQPFLNNVFWGRK